MMHMKSIGINTTHNSNLYINRPHGSGDFVFISLRANANFYMDNSWVKAKKNGCIIYTPTYPQIYYSDEENYSNDYMHFTCNDISYLKDFSLPLNEFFYPRNIDIFTAQLLQIQEESIRSDIFYLHSVSLRINLFLISIAREIENINSTHNIRYETVELLRQLRVEMINSIQKKWSIDDMASKVFLSKSYFQSVYKSLFGVSPNNDLIHHRIQRSKFYLRNTDMTLKNISKEVGYNNEFHFIRQFKKNTGSTPKKFK